MGIYQTGKIIRLNRILGKEKTIIVPLDDSMTTGPYDGLANIKNTIINICKSKANAILTYKGTYDQNLMAIKEKGSILNLSASTMRSRPTHKHIVNSVEQALIMGFDGVAVHVNMTSQYEGEMLKDFGIVSDVCYHYNIPLMAIIYPRGEYAGGVNDYQNLKSSNLKEYTEMVMHCVRIAVEMGADIIKTKYTGTVDSFSNVVKVSEEVPIVIAGGNVLAEELVLSTAEDAILAGARGICFGRNIFNSQNPCKIVNKLYERINNVR